MSNTIIKSEVMLILQKYNQPLTCGFIARESRLYYHYEIQNALTSLVNEGKVVRTKFGRRYYYAI